MKRYLLTIVVMLAVFGVSAQTAATRGKKKVEEPDTMPFKDRLSFRTNAVDWALSTANIGAEFDISNSVYNRYTVGAVLKYNPKSKGTLVPKYVYDLFEAKVEARKYWRTDKNPRTGKQNPHSRYWRAYYAGVWFDYMDINLKLSQTGRKGKAYGIGGEFGYNIPMYAFKKSSLDVEFGVSLGLEYAKYDVYKYSKFKAITNKDGEYIPYSNFDNLGGIHNVDYTQEMVDQYMKQHPDAKRGAEDMLRDEDFVMEHNIKSKAWHIIPFPVPQDLKLAFVYRFRSISQKYKRLDFKRIEALQTARAKYTQVQAEKKRESQQRKVDKKKRMLFVRDSISRAKIEKEKQMNLVKDSLRQVKLQKAEEARAEAEARAKEKAIQAQADKEEAIYRANEKERIKEVRQQEAAQKEMEKQKKVDMKKQEAADKRKRKEEEAAERAKVKAEFDEFKKKEQAELDALRKANQAEDEKNKAAIKATEDQAKAKAKEKEAEAKATKKAAEQELADKTKAAKAKAKEEAAEAAKSEAANKAAKAKAENNSKKAKEDAKKAEAEAKAKAKAEAEAKMKAEAEAKKAEAAAKKAEAEAKKKAEAEAKAKAKAEKSKK